jgi:hypothetical protein
MKIAAALNGCQTMTYRYDFDDSRAGDFWLNREDYLILHEAYGLLRDELDIWNRRALEHGAARPPYEQELADLTRMIEWGNEQLTQNRTDIIVSGVSVGSLRYAKAALMFAIWRREQDRAEKAHEGWPSAALASITDGIERIRKIANIIGYDPSDLLWEVMPRSPGITGSEGAEVMEWDVFISHASEDKEGFARPLAEGLTARGLRVWFDEFTLTIGDSLRRSIDRGLAHSRFGVVVISPDFLRKEWPQKELDGLVAREVGGVKVILPVWHRINANEIRAYSPTLADRVAASSDKGLDCVIEELIRAIRKDDESDRTAGRSNPHTPRAAEIVDHWVNMEYPQKLGLIEKLKADGYDVYWERATDEATRIDVEGWEHVIVERPDGTHARLKIRDAPIVGGYIVLLKKKKGFQTR